MVKVTEEEIQNLRKRIRSYCRKEIRFYEPHVTERILERGGRRELLIENILDPSRLAFFRTRIGKYGDTVHELFFDLGVRHTLVMPVIFDEGGKKCLYIMTYIERHRSWNSMV